MYNDHDNRPEGAGANGNQSDPAGGGGDTRVDGGYRWSRNDERASFTPAAASEDFYEAGARRQASGPDPRMEVFGQKKKKRTGAVVALVLVLCLIVGTIGVAGGMFIEKYWGQPASPSVVVPSGPQDEGSEDPSGGVQFAENPDGDTLTIAQIAAKNQNSVVELSTEKAVTGGWMREFIMEGAGSGVVLTQDGYIVTNNHVIEGATKITVTLHNGTSYDATLVGTSSNADVAIIKVDAENLVPVTLGNSSDLQVGDSVVAIGNPLGRLGGTVTDGIISALDREMTIDGRKMNLMQTNAAINPGNSGGGLFDARGNLVGIVVAKSSGSAVEGLGFVIPIDDVKDLIGELIDGVYAGDGGGGAAQPERRVLLGVTMQEVPGVIAGGQMRTLVQIVEVVPGSAAEEAGVQVGDIVLTANGESINASQDLSDIVAASEVGDELELMILRDNQTISVTATLKAAS